MQFVGESFPPFRCMISQKSVESAAMDTPGVIFMHYIRSFVERRWVRNIGVELWF